MTASPGRAGTGTVKVLIVDDEPLARQRVEDLLSDDPRVEIVGTADSGTAALEAIRQLHPDIVFLDVQMPGKTGLEVVRELDPHEIPAIVFVTAYDQHALKAFELAAVDYLVKPFDDDRFEQALKRAREIVTLKDMGRLREQLLAVLHGGARASPDSVSGSDTSHPRGERYLERIAVDMRGKVRVVPVSDIDYITASGPYAELHVGDRRFVIREAMQDLETRLDPEQFFRIHRSAIIRLGLVDTLLRDPGGDVTVQLKGGTRLRVSRSRREALEQRLGLG